MAITKRAAKELASRVIGISRHGYQWVVTCPHSFGDPLGLYTHSQPKAYAEARSEAARDKKYLVALLCGETDLTYYEYTYMS